MKIAAIQFNPLIGAVADNTQNMLGWLERARNQGCELVVFPELAVTGYPPRDLLDFPDIIKANFGAIESLIQASRGISIVCGFVDRNRSSSGRPFHNSALVISNEKILGRYHKQLLPSYDVFDEERYFESGHSPFIFELAKKKFGISICEDIWNYPGFTDRPYRTNPMDAVRGNVDCLLNLSASPFHLGKPEIRERLLGVVAQDVRSPVLFCNQVGGNDELLFDGGSEVVSQTGAPLVRAPFFQEDCLMFEMGKPISVERPMPRSEVKWLVDALTMGLRDYVRKTGHSQVLLGLSGGIDSSVVAALAVRALGPKNVRALHLPSRFTSRQSEEDAASVAQNLNISLTTYPIQPLLDLNEAALKSEAAPLSALALENIQPRVRMTLLMAVANSENRLLLNTSNKSELATGYCTLYGDSAGALSVLGDVTKGKVRELARHFNQEGERIPSRVIERAPSAELREGQKDEDTLPPYDLLDKLVEARVTGRSGRIALGSLGIPANHLETFCRLHRTTEYKRSQLPPILRVSAGAFGRGRRIPVAAKDDL